MSKFLLAIAACLVACNGLEIYCVNIFDTRTDKLDPEGYAVVDLPRVGRAARFGTYEIDGAQGLLK